MRLLILIILIIIVSFITYKIVRHRLKNKIETITCYTGGLGSGKTLMSVQLALKLYRRNTFRHYTLKKLVCKIKALATFQNPKQLKMSLEKIEREKPLLFSNIPILISKGNYSKKLTKEHLLLQERLPLHSVVLLDEIGSFASQFMFKDENVIKVCDEFIRFYRHYTQGGYLVVNDQCSENVNLVVRRRINIVHNLSNCVVLFKHFCFYYDRQISISEEIKTIDQVQDENEADTQDNKVLHFKLLGRRHYDTYCYSDRYTNVPCYSFTSFEKMKTNSLLRCPKDKEKQYQAKTE